MTGERTALNLLGELLIRQVRDESIDHWDRISESQMQDRRYSAALAALGKGSSPDQVLREILPSIVDTTLHYLLWSIEQSRTVKLMVQVQGNEYDAAKVSDGLPGELYSEDGWIARFSSERYSPPI
jgi:hypothetical protein